MIRWAYTIVTKWDANSFEASKAIGAGGVFSIGAYRTACTIDTLHVARTWMSIITTQHRDTLTTDAMVIGWAVSFLGAEREAMPFETSEPRRTLGIISTGAYRTARAVYTLHTVGAGIVFRIATKIWEADAVDTLMSRWAICVLATDRIAMS